MLQVIWQEMLAQPMWGAVIVMLGWGAVMMLSAWLGRSTTAPRATPERSRRAREVVAQHYRHEARRRRRERRVEAAWDPEMHSYDEGRRWRDAGADTPGARRVG